MKVDNFMNFAVRYAAETETQMNAIERIKEYIGVPNEDYSGEYQSREQGWDDTGFSANCCIEQDQLTQSL